MAEDPAGAAGVIGAVGVDAQDLVGGARYLLASNAITCLLAPRPDDDLADCDFHLYLWDEAQQRLLPTFEPEGGESEGWEPGKGATGRAWQAEEYVLVEGEEVSDATYGLTGAQCARYSGLAVVAAIPVLNAAGDIIGVLTAASTDPQSPLKSPEGKEHQDALAAQVARVLIDVLKWFLDSYDGDFKGGPQQ